MTIHIMSNACDASVSAAKDPMNQPMSSSAAALFLNNKNKHRTFDCRKCNEAFPTRDEMMSHVMSNTCGLEVGSSAFKPFPPRSTPRSSSRGHEASSLLRSRPFLAQQQPNFKNERDKFGEKEKEKIFLQAAAPDSPLTTTTSSSRNPHGLDDGLRALTMTSVAPKSSALIAFVSKNLKMACVVPQPWRRRP